MQAEEMLEYPYGNAFQPPVRSGLAPSKNGIGVSVHVKPKYDNNTVFEAKFEIDSFASFFHLSNMYWQATGDTKFLNTHMWRPAVSGILTVIRKQQQPTYNSNRRVNPPLVGYQRLAWDATETQFGSGMGNPAKYTGMVKTLFRPSDDATMFPFLVPANAFLSVELNSLGKMLNTLGIYADIAQDALELAKDIRQGVLEYGTAVHPKYGRVFAYETDGYGSALIMDDANGPSLLSLPYLGFIDIHDPL
ncbi:hypothetical protein EV175_007093, partial [Coemansia sp. RSA 1933]